MSAANLASTSAGLLEQATRLHQAGELARAESLYEGILSGNPHHADALYYLAGLRQQLARHDEAIAQFGKAIDLMDRDAVALPQRRAQAWLNMGVSHKALEDLARAENCFRRAIDLLPGFAAAHFNLGVVLFETGRFDEAVGNYESARLFRPQHAGTCSNLAAALAALNRPQESLIASEQAIGLKPDLVEAHVNRAIALMALGRRQDALQCCDRALQLAPDHAQALVNKADALLAMEQFEEALACADRVLAIRRGDLAALGHRGAALTALQRHEDAIESCDRALEQAPGHTQALNNKGHALVSLGRPQEALTCFRAAIAADPNCAGATCNLGIARLLLGHYNDDAWHQFEARWQLPTAEPYRHGHLPRWSGSEDLNGKTILVWAEQGYGDTLQFCRLVSPLAQTGAKVIFEVPPPLRGLLSKLDRAVAVHPMGEPLPQTCDYQIPLMGLPRALQLRLESLPGVVPYIESDPAKRSSWEERLPERRAGVARIGLACSGFQGRFTLRHRAVPLREFTPLYDRAQLILLQKDVRPEDEFELRNAPILDLRNDIHDFSDTAALIDAMDMVISVDTAVAHLAGAMGKDLQVLLSYASDWRWLLDRSDSPWYPSARLHRQRHGEAWKDVIARLCEDLTPRLLRLG